MAKKEDIKYGIIEGVLDREINRSIDWKLIDKIGTIGIDEIAIKKGYDNYVTVISSSNGSVIRKRKRRSQTVLRIDTRKIETNGNTSVYRHVWYDGYVNAATEVFGDKRLVTDRYHVSKLYRKPLDTLRISELYRLKTKLFHEDYTKLKGIMWTLRKKYECLNKADKASLEFLYKHSPVLQKAHRIALKLTHIFNNHSSRKSALGKIQRWMISVTKSNIKIFDTFIPTLKTYLSYIALF